MLPVATGVALVGGLMLGLALGRLVDSPGGAAPTGNAAALACQLNEDWGGHEAAAAVERDGLSDGFGGGTQVATLETIASAALVAGNEDDQYEAFGEAGMALFAGITALNLGQVHEALDQLERECVVLGF